MGTLFFWLSKLVWAVLSPDNLFVVFMLVAVVCLARKKSRWRRWTLGVFTVLLLLVCLFSVGEWLYYPLETRFSTNPPLPEKVDGIIVLGGTANALKSKLWQQTEMSESVERWLAFVALGQRYPQATLVFTGGSGSITDQANKEATLVKPFLATQGLDLSRLILEEESRNTYENAVYSKALARPDPNETWLLITTAWHMPRSVGVFRKVGWSVLPYPVDHQSKPGYLLAPHWDFAAHLVDLKWASKEWVGLVVYYLTGKTSALLPGPAKDGSGCRITERITDSRQ